MHAGAAILITAAALLAGALFWIGLVYWHRRRPLSVRQLFMVVLVVGVLGRLAAVVFTPTFYAPDEQSHFNYIKYLAEKRDFPVQAGRMGESDNEWEYFQPPLYYLLLVPLYRAVEALFHNTATTVLVLRFVSVLLWVVNIRLGLLLLKRLGVKDELVWLSTMTLACLLPTYLFVSAAINNDNLLITVGTGLACLMAQQKRSLQNSLGMGVTLGLALWVKQSALIFVPAIGLLFLLEAVRRHVSWRGMFGHLALALGLAAVIASPWAFRNWRVYGTLTPEDLSAAAKAWPSLVDGLLSAGHNLTKTFWSVSGISNDIGYPFPLLGICFALLCVAGLVLGRKQEPQPVGKLLGATTPPVLAALALAVLVNVLLVLRFGYLYGMGQGRHLFPLLYPIALGLAWGLKSIPSHHPTVHMVGFWVTYALSFEAFSLCRFPS